MQSLKAILGLLGTIVIAGWVAYAVSAPRNVDNAMNQPMESLGGSSINEKISEAQEEARNAQCEQYSALANDAWDRPPAAWPCSPSTSAPGRATWPRR